MELTSIGMNNLQAFRFYFNLENYGRLLSDPTVLGIGVTEYGVACGALIFSVTGQNVRLLSLFIHPDYRNRGFATALLDYVIGMSEEDEGINSIYTEYYEGNEQKGLRAFLEGYHFRFEHKEVAEYSCKLTQIKKLTYFTDIQQVRINSNISLLEEIPGYQWKQFLNEMENKGENLISDEAETGVIDPKISTVRLNGDKVIGCIAFMRGEKSLTLLWAHLPQEQMADFVPMLKLAASQAFVLCTEDTQLIIPAISPASLKLIQKLMGEEIQVTEQLVRAELEIA